MSRESVDAFDAWAKRKGYRPGTWNYIRTAEAWHTATAQAEAGYAPDAAPASPAQGDEAQAQWNPEPPCWLVEKRSEGRPVGYLGHALGSFGWMPTPDKATRFVRREDANGVAECFELEDVIVAEHIWG
jgi:hypothetical protein